MTLNRFLLQTVSSSTRGARKKTARRRIRAPKSWLLLTFVIISCSLIGISLLRGSFQGESTNPVITTVTIEVRYEHPEAGEVFFIWGINGWQTVPEALRLTGTTLAENGVMRTPLNQERGDFIGQVIIPSWSTFQYGFMIMATNDGREVAIWDGSEEYELHVGENDRTIEVSSSVELNPDQISTDVDPGE